MHGREVAISMLNSCSFKERVAAMWRPERGIFVQELDDRRFLFNFFHEYDISRVLEDGPWIYDNMYILLRRLMPNEALAVVPLDSLDFWVQIHNLLAGFMSTSVGKQFVDFVGKFIQYDETNNTMFGASYMRVKVRIDVLQPLKRSKRILLSNGSSSQVLFKYERLGLFCVLCGKLGNTKSFCDFHFSMAIDSMAHGWGNWLKASFRAPSSGGGWLRDEKGEPIHFDGLISETSSVFSGSLVPSR